MTLLARVSSCSPVRPRSGRRPDPHYPHPRPPIVSSGIPRANSKNYAAAAQLTHPQAVALEVAVAGMAQAAGMGVDHADQGQPLAPLPHDPASQRLPAAIEADVCDTGVAV